MKVTKGQNVSVHYKGTFVDGTEFDNSRARGTPIDFEIGSGRMIAGFNDAVVGMAIGETKSITLGPTEAYGQRIDEAVQTVPRAAFGPDFEFEVGGMVQGNGPAGPFIAKIEALEEDSVVLDLNHPLAGKELNFEIELISVSETAPPTTDDTTTDTVTE